MDPDGEAPEGRLADAVRLRSRQAEQLAGWTRMAKRPKGGLPTGGHNRLAQSIGATRSMSSWQWRGGSGSSSLAAVIRTSVPQMLQR
jgi:hypothetical protein